LAFAMCRIVTEALALVNAWMRDTPEVSEEAGVTLAAAEGKIIVLRRANLGNTGWVSGGQATHGGVKAGLPVPRML